MTTQAVYQQPQILDFRNTDGKRPLFIVNKILNQKKTFSILTSFIPGTLAPSKFIALSKLKLPFEDALREVCRREEDRIIDQFVNEERALLRDEKKRPWGNRTRRPFRGIIDTVKPTFSEILELAGKVVEKLGLPKTDIQKKLTMDEKQPTI
jgi:hypothetical protein